MNREQMEATLLLHGWRPGLISGAPVWVKEGRRAMGYSLWQGGVFTPEPWAIRQVVFTNIAVISYGDFREMFDRIVESKEGL